MICACVLGCVLIDLTARVGVSPVMQPFCQILNRWVMARRGIFAVSMMLPFVCIFYNVWNATYNSVFNVCLARSLYVCFFALNFAAGRTKQFIAAVQFSD